MQESRSSAASEETQREFFEEAAARYDNRFCRSRWPRNQQLKARVIAKVLGDGMREGPVLELGCGTGQIAAELLEWYPQLRYIGLDLSPGMLEVAARRLERFGGRAELRAVSGSALPLAGEPLAGVFGVDVLHHVEDVGAVLAQLRPALGRGGRLVFLEGNPRFPLTALIGALRREERGLFKMRPPNLRRWLEEAGFEDAVVEYGPLYTPPGPERVEPLLDRIDSVLGAIPFVRGLAIFYVARAQAPLV